MLKIEEPIDDVLKIKMFNKSFCEEIVKISESFGEWSAGNDTMSMIKGLVTKKMYLHKIYILNK